MLPLSVEAIAEEPTGSEDDTESEEVVERLSVAVEIDETAVLEVVGVTGELLELLVTIT